MRVFIVVQNVQYEAKNCATVTISKWKVHIKKCSGEKLQKYNLISKALSLPNGIF